MPPLWPSWGNGSGSRTVAENRAAGSDGPPPPRANPEFVGHGEAATALLGSYRSGRLAHAWLLAGPPGVGKATLAYRFARFILAGGGGSLGDAAAALAVDPDDPVFRRVAAGSHADLLTVEPAVVDERTGARRDEIKVAEVRAVGPFLRLTPAEGGWRVVVVDRADHLNVHAANALLKVLEEPSNNVLIFLVSDAPSRMLSTIRSRCRKIVLRPIDEGRVADFLRRYRPELEAEEAAALGRLAEGSPGRALRLADEGGLALYRELVGLVSQAPKLDTEALHGLADRVNRAGAGTTYRTVMDLHVQWLARLVRTGATGAAQAEVIAGEGDVMRRLLALRSLEQWVEVWEKVRRLTDRAERAKLDRKQVVIAAFTALETASRP